MVSTTPKVLHEICGRTLIGHAVVAAEGIAADRLVVVVGSGSVETAGRGPVAAALGPGARPQLDAPATPEAILRALPGGSLP